MLNLLQRKRKFTEDNQECLIVCETQENRQLIADIHGIIPDIISYLRARKVDNGDFNEIDLNDLLLFFWDCKNEVDSLNQEKKVSKFDYII